MKTRGAEYVKIHDRMLTKLKVYHAAVVLANEDGRRGTWIYVDRNERGDLSKLVRSAEENQRKFEPNPSTQ